MVPLDTRPLRICFFNRSYWPDLGATGQLLTELAEDLVARHGCQVSVVAGPAANGDEGHGRRWPVHHSVHNGVDVLRAAGTVLDRRRFAGRAANYLTYFGSACLAGLRIPEPDVVVALTDPPVIGLAGLLAARRFGAAFVFLCQDVFPEVAALLEDFHSAAADRMLERTSRLLVRKAEGIIVLGETMRARLVIRRGADPHRIDVIHNWADCSAIVPAAKRNAFSEAHGLVDKFVVMHSGNLGLSQDLEVLVEAARHLRHAPEIEVVFVGDGVKKRSLQELVAAHGLTNVRFIPYQPRERLVESFASADVFVISLRQGLAGYIVPSKLYGILAAGRPYVAAVEEECEVTAISKAYECGLLAEPGKPRDLAEKILKLYYDRPLGRRLGENARKAALQFDRPAQIAKYYETLQRVAAQKSAMDFARRAH